MKAWNNIEERNAVKNELITRYFTLNSQEKKLLDRVIWEEASEETHRELGRWWNCNSWYWTETILNKMQEKQEYVADLARRAALVNSLKEGDWFVVGRDDFHHVLKVDGDFITFETFNGMEDVWEEAQSLKEGLERWKMWDTYRPLPADWDKDKSRQVVRKNLSEWFAVNGCN